MGIKTFKTASNELVKSQVDANVCKFFNYNSKMQLQRVSSSYKYATNNKFQNSL